MNVVVVGWNDAVATISSVTDTKKNTYSLVIGPTTATALSQSIYYAKNIAGAAAGTNTVMVKFNQAPTIPDIRILEYSGLSTTSPLDVTAFGSREQLQHEHRINHYHCGKRTHFWRQHGFYGTTGPGSGFTSRIITAAGDIAEDEIVSAIGSYDASAPLGSSGPWVMQMATFEAPVITSGAPTVASLSPSSGTDNGGTSVTITGTNFVSGASATFGGTDAHQHHRRQQHYHHGNHTAGCCGCRDCAGHQPERPEWIAQQRLHIYSESHANVRLSEFRLG